ncbi:MAG: hypothetical protein KAX49_07615 [Halanaerobiales bacterium]|nr:hypothetical protein [Halanaerobiales bacterium]
MIIGAGVSASAGIPTADGIMNEIQTTYKNKYERLKPKEYAEHMKVITPVQRKELINRFINNAKLNPAHLYMSSIINAVKKNYLRKL